jgi:hypothetical protein
MYACTHTHTHKYIHRYIDTFTHKLLLQSLNKLTAVGLYAHTLIHTYIYTHTDTYTSIPVAVIEQVHSSRPRRLEILQSVQNPSLGLISTAERPLFRPTFHCQSQSSCDGDGRSSTGCMHVVLCVRLCV